MLDALYGRFHCRLKLPHVFVSPSNAEIVIWQARRQVFLSDSLRRSCERFAIPHTIPDYIPYVLVDNTDSVVAFHSLCDEIFMHQFGI
jgi:hypothetical protein